MPAELKGWRIHNRAKTFNVNRGITRAEVMEEGITDIKEEKVGEEVSAHPTYDSRATDLSSVSYAARKDIGPSNALIER